MSTKHAANGVHTAPRDMTVYADPEGQGDNELGGTTINPDMPSAKRKADTTKEKEKDCCSLARAHLTVEQRKVMLVVGILYAKEKGGNHRDKASTYAWMQRKYLHVMRWAKADFYHHHDMNSPRMPIMILLVEYDFTSRVYSC